MPVDIDSDKDDDNTMDGLEEDGRRNSVDMDVDEATTSSVTPPPASTAAPASGKAEGETVHLLLKI